MVKEIVVILDTGIPLFHYGIIGERKIDELVSGFLSAMGSFAESIGGEPVKVISFAENKLVWVKKGNLFFIAMISQNDSEEIYWVILQELADQFVGMYYEELMKEWQDPRMFRPFAEVVELTLQRFNGVPGLARRYKTALLPINDLNQIKNALVHLEDNDYILRGAVLTQDAYIIVSTLRTYELEAILDLFPTIMEDKEKACQGLLIVHTSLDPVTSFFVVNMREQCFCVFVVHKSLENDKYLEIIKPFISLVKKINLSLIKRVHPMMSKETLTFYDYDLVVPKRTITEMKVEIPIVLKGLTEEHLEQSMNIIEQLEGNITIADLEELTHYSKDAITEILAYLIAKDFVQICKIYPIMPERDDRFSAYLELIGIPKKDFDIVDMIWKYCNGSYSIQEISNKTGIPASRILDVLRKLGNQVKWETERVLSRVG